jgi:maltose/maltodextrin transport system permease protein
MSKGIASASMAIRYLMPAMIACAVFAVFPMLYTVSLGFTNYSSRNLLEQERVREYHLQERIQEVDSELSFALQVPQGKPEQSKIFLVNDRNQVLAQTDAFTLNSDRAQTITLNMRDLPAVAPTGLGKPALVGVVDSLRQLTLAHQDGRQYTLASLTQFASTRPLYLPGATGGLVDRLSNVAFDPDPINGFFTSAKGERLQPGYQVNVGWRHYTRMFTDERFRAPFISVFVWTILFSAISVSLAAALGMLLAVILEWSELEGRAIYRVVLFLPYAVPGFISIVVFKGLFNQNLGEINLILNGLFGIKPSWFSDPLLAKLMLVIVNVWLGFPYMMVLCSGLIKTIPADLFEASAIAGANSINNFFQITLPLIIKPLTPLLISAFAFNFNNFVLISLLTNGRPDQLDTALPAGTTDILVSYTWRIAFQDSGQQFGLAAAISTVIFIIVAAIAFGQMRLTRISTEKAR